MRFPKTLTFFILATALAFALPAWAQQKIVAPTLRSARADVASSLPRHGGVKPPLRHADLKVSAATALSTPANPFTQEQVSQEVRWAGGEDKSISAIQKAKVQLSSPIRFPFLEHSVVQHAGLAQTLGALPLQKFLKGGLPCLPIAYFHSFLLHC
jgi:hypothetical protein